MYMVTREPLGKLKSRTGSKGSSMLHLLQDHTACFLYLTLDD